MHDFRLLLTFGLAFTLLLSAFALGRSNATSVTFKEVFVLDQCQGLPFGAGLLVDKSDLKTANYTVTYLAKKLRLAGYNPQFVAVPEDGLPQSFPKRKDLELSDAYRNETFCEADAICHSSSNDRVYDGLLMAYLWPNLTKASIEDATQCMSRIADVLERAEWDRVCKKLPFTPYCENPQRSSLIWLPEVIFGSAVALCAAGYGVWQLGTWLRHRNYRSLGPTPYTQDIDL